MPRNGNMFNVEEQQRILEAIRQEQEERMLEMALKASIDMIHPRNRAMHEWTVSEHDTTTSKVPSSSTSYTRFQLEQQKAREKMLQNRTRPPVESIRTVPSNLKSAKRPTSIVGSPSDERRQILLQLQQSLEYDDKNAPLHQREQIIFSGQCRMVDCRGCRGRLQAPMLYPLVVCPLCYLISPAH